MRWNESLLQQKPLVQHLKKIFETKALYTWCSVELPEFSDELYWIKQIEMVCPNCKKSRPFSDKRTFGAGSGMPRQKLESSVQYFTFSCDTCFRESFRFYLEIDVSNKKIRKIGQTPPWSIEVDKELSIFLGEDTEYFKKGVVCESQSYGIAAFAYYRRVAENTIGHILSDLKSVLQEEHAPDEVISRIDKAMACHVATDRIEIAKELLPSSLRPNNVNPLSAIYAALSAGIHSHSDQECLENAENIRISLEFVVRALSLHKVERERFLSAMKRLT